MTKFEMGYTSRQWCTNNCDINTNALISVFTSHLPVVEYSQIHGVTTEKAAYKMPNTDDPSNVQQG